MEVKYYECGICGKIIAMVKDSGVPTICCGQPMKELIPGTSDGAAEKHVPVVTQVGNLVRVQIGEVIHPMLDAHHIEWIAIETREGYQVQDLKPGEEPVAEFLLPEGDELVAAFEHCNIHGLWKK